MQAKSIFIEDDIDVVFNRIKDQHFTHTLTPNDLIQLNNYTGYTDMEVLRIFIEYVHKMGLIQLNDQLNLLLVAHTMRSSIKRAIINIILTCMLLTDDVEEINAIHYNVNKYIGNNLSGECVKTPAFYYVLFSELVTNEIYACNAIGLFCKQLREYAPDIVYTFSGYSLNTFSNIGDIDIGIAVFKMLKIPMQCDPLEMVIYQHSNINLWFLYVKSHILHHMHQTPDNISYICNMVKEQTNDYALYVLLYIANNIPSACEYARINLIDSNFNLFQYDYDGEAQYLYLAIIFKFDLISAKCNQYDTIHSVVYYMLCNPTENTVKSLNIICDNLRKSPADNPYIDVYQFIVLKCAELYFTQPLYDLLQYFIEIAYGTVNNQNVANYVINMRDIVKLLYETRVFSQLDVAIISNGMPLTINNIPFQYVCLHTRRIETSILNALIQPIDIVCNSTPIECKMCCCSCVPAYVQLHMCKCCNDDNKLCVNCVNNYLIKSIVNEVRDEIGEIYQFELEHIKLTNTIEELLKSESKLNEALQIINFYELNSSATEPIIAMPEQIATAEQIATPEQIATTTHKKLVCPYCRVTITNSTGIIPITLYTNWNN